MTQVIEEMLKNYKLQSKSDYHGAIQEIMQEITLMGLWRAKFFEKAAFYGGTSLRILYGLNRFSEDLDFSLLKPDLHFNLHPYLNAVEEELAISGLNVTVSHKIIHPEGSIQSAFLKTGTLETFIRIGLDEQLKRHIQSNEVIKLKLEIDVDPPQKFETEIRYLTRPFPFSIRSYTPENLFAGKMHALLCRPYKVRVKGRDWYDFVWYVSQGFHLHLAHLEMRMRQSGHYKDKTQLTAEKFIELMNEKIEHLDIKMAQEDIRRFIQTPRVIEGWSKPFFQSLLPKIQFTNPTF